jgi:jasmonic acid-amino synthetase
VPFKIQESAVSGLYRYRLGDVVKVKGFYNSTPKLQFVCRRNLMLNINIDKNTEKDLQLSVEAAATILAAEKLEVVDFSSQVNFSRDPAHYVIYWEISGYASEAVLKECCNCLDRSFVDAGYVGSRKVKTIGPLELRLLKKGTFHKILDHYVNQGAAVSQFKTPRCVGPSNSVVSEILGKNVAQNYFSTAFD